MNTIFGLIVLTGPLFLIVLWIPVCIMLAIWVGRKFIKKTLPLKIAGGMAVFLILFILPFADEIAGRIYFNHLCETEAGAKVYQTIELPAEYWDEDGKPNFYDESNGNFTLPQGKFYKVEFKKTNRLFGVKERRTFILDINTHQIIGENPWFLYWGGYVLRNFAPHKSAIDCGANSAEFVKKQFTPATQKKESKS